MKAMILAAGLGTRLGELSRTRPKALAEIHGRTLLEIALARLREFGFDDVVINLHHFAAMVEEYLAAHANFGMRILLSRESELLDTGGGVLKAAPLLIDSSVPDGDGVGANEEPILLHNVDIVSSIDLAAMAAAHRANGALATLAVQRREGSRLLLFDGKGELCGRSRKGHATEMARAVDEPEALGFCGIHMLSPRLLRLMATEPRAQAAFSIVPEYLRLAEAGERIRAFRADGAYWRDLGTQAALEEAAREMA
jgi:NDP-sugar pyrophosphorylase family protein